MGANPNQATGNVPNGRRTRKLKEKLGRKIEEEIEIGEQPQARNEGATSAGKNLWETTWFIKTVHLTFFSISTEQFFVEIKKSEEFSFY